jgi:hypothetical protein
VIFDVFSSPSVNNLNPTAANTTNTDPMDVNTDLEGSGLTTAISGEILTDPFNEAPTIQALINAKDDAAYNALVASIPSRNKYRAPDGIEYVKMDPYRSKKSKKTAWYWHPALAEELIRTTKGMPRFKRRYIH